MWRFCMKIFSKPARKSSFVEECQELANAYPKRNPVMSASFYLQNQKREVCGCISVYRKRKEKQKYCVNSLCLYCSFLMTHIEIVLKPISPRKKSPSYPTKIDILKIQSPEATQQALFRLSSQSSSGSLYKLYTSAEASLPGSEGSL